MARSEKPENLADDLSAAFLGRDERRRRWHGHHDRRPIRFTLSGTASGGRGTGGGGGGGGELPLQIGRHSVAAGAYQFVQDFDSQGVDGNHHGRS